MIATGDFDEDGTIDFAVAIGDVANGGINSSVAIVIGTGSRTYRRPSNIPWDTFPSGSSRETSTRTESPIWRPRTRTAATSRS